MKDVVFLDTGPLGFLTNPSSKPLPVAIRQWLTNLLRAGRRVILPEIADYEIRREFIRAKLIRSLGRLDALSRLIEYRPLDTPTMRIAANLWAQARTFGYQTAPDLALDGDVILAAQALSLGVPAVVASGNWAHLSRYVPAQDWQTIIA